MELPLADVVIIKASDSSGKLVQQAIIPIHDWYEELHPLIDEPNERRSHGIYSIDGEQYDLNGLMTARWRVVYDVNGEVVDLIDLDV